jgi:hypothetical protein
MIDDLLLALRPTNAMHQLGVESRVPLFNARVLADGLAGSAATLWMPRLAHPAAAAGVLRAAAHQHAVVGFCLGDGSQEPIDFRHSARPGVLFSAVAQACDDVDQAPPFCLHLQTPPVDESEGAASDAVRDLIADCVQVGFTSFGVDLSANPPDDWARLAESWLEPVLLLELAVSVRLPTDQAEQVAMEALLRVGIEPEWVLRAGRDLGLQAFRPDGETCAALLAEPVGASVHPAGGDGQPDPDRLEAMAYLTAMQRIEELGLKGCLDGVLSHLVSLCG